MLQTCGYAVNAFNDPLLALDHFRRHSHDYGRVISDMILPSMSGLEFIKNIRIVNPEIVTFIITALDDIKDTSKDLLYDSTVLELDGIIDKPISLDDLRTREKVIRLENFLLRDERIKKVLIIGLGQLGLLLARYVRERI